GEPVLDPEAARQAALDDAAQFGTIGLLAASNVLVQTGQPRPTDLAREWQVDVGARVYWPNGTLAGSVRQLHAFVKAGETRRLDGRGLRWFAGRAAPPLTLPPDLCFEPAADREATPMSTAGLLTDESTPEVWGGLIGEVDEAVSFGGLGIGLQNG